MAIDKNELFNKPICTNGDHKIQSLPSLKKAEDIKQGPWLMSSAFLI